MKKFAIAGTIGSGKSTFAETLRQQGYEIFDADQCGKDFLKSGQDSYDEIVAHFGKDILGEDGEIVNAKLAAKVFGNEEERKTLNGFLHPRIKQSLLDFFEKHKTDTLVFAEIPLLFEVKWESLFDEIILVTCRQETAVERMIKNRGYSEEQAYKRIASQVDVHEQIERSDLVFHNDGTIEQFRKNIRDWLKKTEKEEQHGKRSQGERHLSY